MNDEKTSDEKKTEPETTNHEIKNPGRRQQARELAAGWAVLPVRGMNRKERRRLGVQNFNGIVGGKPLRRDTIRKAFGQYRGTEPDHAPTPEEVLMKIEPREIDAPAPRRFARRGITSAKNGPSADQTTAPADPGGGTAAEEQCAEGGAEEPAGAR